MNMFDQAGQPTDSESLSRRTLITRVTAAGIGLGALGLMSSAEASPLFQQGNAQGSSAQAGGQPGDGKSYPQPKPNPKNEKEYRQLLMPAAVMSLESSQLATQRANNAAVKVFAGFETAETQSVTKVLREMGTPQPQMDATMRAAMAKLQAAQGAEFDQVYLTAQMQTHEYLRDLAEGFINNSANSRSRDERHTRHLAMLSLPTILEHLAHTRGLMQGGQS